MVSDKMFLLKEGRGLVTSFSQGLGRHPNGMNELVA
eukprot:COSAG02_NODE_51842_length_311_cov_1.212264_1_plen_35_part_10